MNKEEQDRQLFDYIQRVSKILKAIFKRDGFNDWYPEGAEDYIIRSVFEAIEKEASA